MRQTRFHYIWDGSATRLGKKMGKAENILALDIGGTKIAAAIVKTDGSLRHIGRIPTPQDGPEDAFEQIASLVQTCFEEGHLEIQDVLGIGIGIAAALETETDKIIWAPNIRGWRNVDLRGFLETRFRIPTCLEYDGHAAVLGEYWQGAGKGFHSVLDVIIGTGVGAGAIIDGHLIRGKNRLAGAMGWQVLSLDPRKDGLNSESLGYWESLTAGPGIARYAQKMLSEADAIRIAGNEKEITAKNLFDAARNGDGAAMQICTAIGKWIGLGISNAVSILNPDIVVLGGSVGHACGFLLDTIREEAVHWAQPISGSDVKFRVSELGTEAGIFGAAYGVILRSGTQTVI